MPRYAGPVVPGQVGGHLGLTHDEVLHLELLRRFQAGFHRLARYPSGPQQKYKKNEKSKSRSMLFMVNFTSNSLQPMTFLLVVIMSLRHFMYVKLDYSLDAGDQVACDIFR